MATPYVKHLFVYGTLLPDQQSFPVLQGRVSNPQPASVRGALLLHLTEGKNYPFLIYDRLSLEKLAETTGIEPHNVQGILFEIKARSLLPDLDRLEGVLLTEPLEEYTGDQRIGKQPALSRLYVRGEVIAQAGGRKIHAYAYYANKDKSHTRRLVEKPGTKVVIPGGSWVEYMENVSNQSLRLLYGDPLTFGQETEYTLLLPTLKGETALPFLRDRGGFRIISQGKQRAIRYKNLTSFLAQALYGSLQKLKLGGAGLLGEFYDKQGKSNHRFPIPRGVAYVDGEYVEPDGTQVSISRTSSDEGNSGKENSNEEAFQERRSGLAPVPARRFNPEDVFLETAAFPLVVERGFARNAAVDELLRRYELALGLEDVKAVRLKKQTFKKITLLGHSSQYNVILDPSIPEVAGADLSSLATEGYCYSGELLHEERTIPLAFREEVPTYGYHVAFLLSQTYGPLLSWLLTAREAEKGNGFAEFRSRALNRLEYRNTVLLSPEQLMAGIAVYVAAARTVEEQLKKVILERSRTEHAKSTLELTAKDIQKTVARLDPGTVLGAFPFQFPFRSYKPSRFHAGFSIAGEDGYHQLLQQGPNELLTYQYNGQPEQATAQEVIKKLFHEAIFSTQLRSIVTSGEYDTIFRYVHGLEQVEMHRRLEPALTSTNILRRLREFSGAEPEELFQARNTFPEVISRFLFHKRGRVSFNGEKHTLEVILSERIDPKRYLYINSLPIDVRLLKGVADSPQKAELELVDQFTARITPGNVDRLRRAFDLAKYGQQPLWEIYFSLK